ncbi:gliding motility lipoprotein GldH [Cesiribacter andamanensis]|uniref:Gliding motility lipoprotein gldH n=1 Tax=Cesiribacter andamanensis AMV16 TaxID=1279009 RepID=M7NAL3_9BACT|nr:gliding motility lipoprotein GldH [Cesiribacter andamanensis]EMR04282.1 Gliding motility lipoprotein gldH precursor [Cesiribacter andamanensis AMV16]
MTHVLKLAGIGLLLFLMLSACDERRVFEQNVDIKEYAWHKDSVIHFQVPIQQPELGYNIYYNLRNALSYPAQNLYLQIEIADSAGRPLATDLNNIELFDRATGKPYGDGLGDIFDHQVPVYQNFRFPHAGTFDIRIQHRMRESDKRIMKDNHLPFIMSVGIRVEKAASEEEG